MDVMGSDKGSDYITNFAFVPPSPPLDNIAFDYSPFDPAPITHTSSYNGSYYSPYSQHSELSFSGDDIQLQDFPAGMNEYEPSDYDAPNQQGSLLMFTNDTDYMSPHFSLNNTSTRSPFDHSSPSSNASGVDENNLNHLDDLRHSRHSSVASNQRSPSQPPTSHSPQPTFHPSPRLSANFGNMSVNTPNWGTVPLPQPSPNLNAQTSPPAIHKAQSPPQLLMLHDLPEQQQQQQQQNVPIINAPHGDDDMMNRPQFRIVPATPVNGGGPDTNVPFQTTLNQARDSSPSNDHQQSQQRHRDPSPFSFLRTEENNVATSSSRSNHRYSRSEDIRSPPIHYGGNNNGGSSNAPTYRHHQHSNSMGGTSAASTNFLFPPQFLHPSASQQHSLSLLSPAGSASNPNLSLSPPSNLPTRRSLSPSIGHFRRASLGTRSDRGAEVWASSGTHGMSLTTPRRMSPYPSPNASPGVRYAELELDSDLTLGAGDSGGGGNIGLGMGLGLDLGDPPVSAGFSEEVGLTGRSNYSGLDVTSVGAGGSQKAESVVSNNAGERSQTRQSRNNLPSASQTDVLPSQIPKVNVTTGRTANASHRRRKQDANFACTVPGCGSTFTRGFNLKGHLRSHFEEKPYKCHWPGCGKGFARQHDCKRHEQLHSNFRPFECEGCKKQFARMDALNRHLRSEAGVECARIMEKEKGAAGGGGGGGGRVGDMGRAGGYNMGINMTGGMVNLSMESEDEKRSIPKRRQPGGGGGGPDAWCGVAL